MSLSSSGRRTPTHPGVHRVPSAPMFTVRFWCYIFWAGGERQKRTDPSPLNSVYAQTTYRYSPQQGRRAEEARVLILRVESPPWSRVLTTRTNDTSKSFKDKRGLELGSPRRTGDSSQARPKEPACCD